MRPPLFGGRSGERELPIRDGSCMRMARGFVDGALLHATEDVRRDESGEKKSQILRETCLAKKRGELFRETKLGKGAMAFKRNEFPFLFYLGLEDSGFRAKCRRESEPIASVHICSVAFIVLTVYIFTSSCKNY